ncbi:MAG: MMPL family transporter, partial [Candidatus Margulisiibacteriota bacterium]
MSFRVVKYLIAVACMVFGLLLFKTLPLLEFNNDYWLPNDNEYQQDLNYLEREFQPGFGSLVVLKFPNSFFTSENIAFFRAFKANIEQLNYVFKVNSPLDATVIINQDDILKIQTYDEALRDGYITSLDDFKQRFLQSPYYGKLLSTNDQWVGLSVSIEKLNDGNDLIRRVSVIESIFLLLETLPQHIRGFVTGDAAIYYEMDSATQKNLAILLPLALFLLLFIAWLFLRQARSVLIVIIPTLINLGVVPIVIIMMGHYITIINITLFILVLVITVADAIHMLNYWERYTLAKSAHPIADTIRATWLPCFITSITTAVGFGSFATSSIIPLNHYGLESFFVMIFAYIIVMTFVPFLLRMIPPVVVKESDIVIFPRFVEWLSAIISRYTRGISIFVLLFTILISQFLWGLKTETSFISVFFKSDHPVRQQVQLVDKELTGSGRLDVLVRAPVSDQFKHLDYFNDLNERIQASLALPLIKGVNDVTVPVGMIHRAFDGTNTPFPTSNEALEQELLFLEFSRGEAKTDVLSSVVDFNYKNTRIEFITEQLPTSKINDVIQFLKQTFLDVTYGEVAITGSQFLSYVLGNYVLQSQLITVLITLTFIWILFISIFGVRLGTIGMVPNIIPMMITLSLLPITNTPFDFATVLISSVTLGLCVDDTIHWLHYFQLSRKNGDPQPAIQTSQVMFKPLFLTSIILGIGFGVLGGANLVILQKFGAFTTLAIGLAFLSDIVLLP